MATYRSGANSRIVIGEEASYNTMAGTPVGHILRKATFTFDGVKELIENDELRSDGNPAPDLTGMQRVTARIEVPVTPEEMGLLFYWFLTDYTASGAAAPYDHEFLIDTSTAPASLFVEVGDTALTKYDLFNGLYIQSISFGTINKGQSALLKATIEFNASGKYTLNGSSAADASPTVHTGKIHTMPLTYVDVDSTTTAVISEITCTMSRTIEGSGVLDGTLYHSDANLQKYAYDCTIRGWRDSADTIFGLDDDAEHVIEIISPQPGLGVSDDLVSVEVKFPEAYVFNSEGGGGVQGDGPIFSTARVRPFYTDNADGSSVVVTVRCSIEDYDAVV